MGLVPSVPSEVETQVGDLGEAAVADLAGEGPLACVGAIVREQVVLPREGLAAEGAAPATVGVAVGAQLGDCRSGVRNGGILHVAGRLTKGVAGSGRWERTREESRVEEQPCRRLTLVGLWGEGEELGQVEGGEMALGWNL